MIYRGIIHVHSKYSYDSLMSPEQIVKTAMANQLNFIIMSDHETINGAFAVQNIVKKYNLPIEVPLAAEYKTSYGDMIAAFIKREIINMDFDSFENEVKDQGGIILFPHPFKGHKNIEYIVGKSDMIEIFNSRVNKEGNEKALELAVKYKKPMYAGSDAHSVKELLNTILIIDYNGTLKNALLNGKVEVINKYGANQYDIFKSQYVKAMKRKDLKLFILQTKSLVYQLISGNLLRDITKF